MPQLQIRLTRTPEVNQVLTFLRGKYKLLSEADIIKLALSEKYKQEKEEASDAEKDKQVRKAYAHLMKEGKKIGNRLMREKGLDPKKVTEQEFYDIFLDDHKHSA